MADGGWQSYIYNIYNKTSGPGGRLGRCASQVSQLYNIHKTLGGASELGDGDKNNAASSSKFEAKPRQGGELSHASPEAGEGAQTGRVMESDKRKARPFITPRLQPRHTAHAYSRSGAAASSASA